MYYVSPPSEKIEDRLRLLVLGREQLSVQSGKQ
jgi:hypothetical protein